MVRMVRFRLVEESHATAADLFISRCLDSRREAIEYRRHVMGDASGMRYRIAEADEQGRILHFLPQPESAQ